MRKTRCAVCRMDATVRSASAHNRTWPWSQNDESAVEPNGVQLRESRSRALALLQSAWALDLVRPQLAPSFRSRTSAPGKAGAISEHSVSGLPREENTTRGISVERAGDSRSLRKPSRPYATPCVVPACTGPSKRKRPTPGSAAGGATGVRTSMSSFCEPAGRSSARNSIGRNRKAPVSISRPALGGPPILLPELNGRSRRDRTGHRSRAN